MELPVISHVDVKMAVHVQHPNSPVTTLFPVAALSSLSDLEPVGDSVVASDSSV
jgi:D-mannonate dehydratase